MPKRSSKKSKPADISQLARAIVEEATGEALTDQTPAKESTRKKNPAAVALGKLGGKKGGDARAKKLSPE
jgi:glutamine synthetase adenylyltransferase